MRRSLVPLNASMKEALLLMLALLSQVACSQPKTVPTKPTAPLSDEDVALRHKFRGLYGGELRVDSTFVASRVLIINVDTGLLFSIGIGTFRPGADKVSGYGGNIAGDRLAIPKHLRMLRYPEDARLLSFDRFPYYSGSPIVDVTVPVAERIPEETLNDLRNNGGGLRLKLRIHPETLLVGWDIVRRPGYVPGRRDASGREVFVAAQYSSIGGDFCEARIFNGRVIEKGWYIDPKTKQRIETDF